MQQRHFILSFGKQRCRIRGRHGILNTLCVEEVLPNGKKQMVHTKFRYQKARTERRAA